MTTRARRTGARLAAAAVLTAAVLLPGAPAPAAPNDDAVADAPVLTVSSFDPAVPQPGSEITISGTVTAGADDLDDATVRLRVSSLAVTTRGELSSLAAGVSQRQGTERARTELQVDSGDEASWSLKVKANALGLVSAGVYPVSLDLYDRSSTVPVATAVSFISWFPPGSAAQPTSITWVVPLAGRPVRDADDVFIDDSTAVDLAVGGRARTLLDALGGSKVDWAVDPELLEAAEEMAGGYRVRREDGTVTAGGATGTEAARTFLEKARAVLGESTAALGYADPDANALQEAGLEGDLTAAVTTGPVLAESLLKRRVRGDVAVPAGGYIRRAALTRLREAGVRTVVLNENALPPTVPPNYTPNAVAAVSAGAAVKAVLADSTLTSVVTSPEESGGDDLARQRFLAETLVITQERPSDPRALAVAPPRDWDVSGSYAAELVALSDSAPWLDVLPLAELRSGDFAETPRDGLNVPDDAPQISNRQTTAARELGDRLETFAGVLEDPARTSTQYQAAILRTESSAWQVVRQTGTAVADAVRADLDRDIGKVRILSRGAVTLSGTEGRIPITIANDLKDRTVIVDVRISSPTPGRLSVQQPGEVRLLPGRKESLEIEATVTSGGTVPVEVRLFTRDGDEYPGEVTLTVRSTAYSRLGAAVVGAALAALVVLVIARLVRRARGGRSDDAGDGTDGDETAGTTKTDDAEQPDDEA